MSPFLKGPASDHLWPPLLAHFLQDLNNVPRGKFFLVSITHLPFYEDSLPFTFGKKGEEPEGGSPICGKLVPWQGHAQGTLSCSVCLCLFTFWSPQRWCKKAVQSLISPVPTEQASPEQAHRLHGMRMLS